MKKKILYAMIIGAFGGSLLFGAYKIDKSPKIELSADDEVLIKECKKAIYEAYKDMEKGNYKAESKIGDANMYTYSVSMNNNSCYFENGTIGMPNIYFDEVNSLVYFKYDAGCGLPEGYEYDTWYFVDSKDADSLTKYLENRKAEVLINYLEFVIDNSMSVNRDVTFEDKDCIDLEFKYDDTKLFESLNGFSYDDKVQSYTCHYYIDSSDKVVLGVKNNLGEVHVYSWGEFNTPDGLKDATPSSKGMKNGGVSEL